MQNGNSTKQNKSIPLQIRDFGLKTTSEQKRNQSVMGKASLLLLFVLNKMCIILPCPAKKNKKQKSS